MVSNTAPHLNLATELTKERNRLAADRTLMAWIRARRSWELKLTRRQRARELVTLGLFTDAHTR
jgi:hypothetical protein